MSSIFKNISVWVLSIVLVQGALALTPNDLDLLLTLSGFSADGSYSIDTVSEFKPNSATLKSASSEGISFSPTREILVKRDEYVSMQTIYGDGECSPSTFFTDEFGYKLQDKHLIFFTANVNHFMDTSVSDLEIMDLLRAIKLSAEGAAETLYEKEVLRQVVENGRSLDKEQTVLIGETDTVHEFSISQRGENCAVINISTEIVTSSGENEFRFATIEITRLRTKLPLEIFVANGFGDRTLRSMDCDFKVFVRDFLPSSEELKVMMTSDGAKREYEAEARNRPRVGPINKYSRKFDISKYK